MNARARLTAIIGGLLLAAPAWSHAATREWTGAGGDNRWSTANNWSGNVAPTDGDDLVFNTSPFVTIEILRVPLTARLTIRRHQQTVSRFDGQGILRLESTAVPGERGTLILAETTVGVFSGTFEGDGSIRHIGTGSQTVITQSPTATGDLAIEHGSLGLTGTLPMVVAVGPDGVFGVNGSTGPITVTGGTLAYSTTSNTTPALSLTGGILRAHATGTNTGELGKMSVAGPVSLGDTTLAIDLTFPFGAPVGAVLTILDKTSPGPITGTFAGLPEGHEILSTAGAPTPFASATSAATATTSR